MSHTAPHTTHDTRHTPHDTRALGARHTVSLPRRLRGVVESTKFEARLQILSLVIHLYQWWTRVVSWFYSFPTSPVPVLDS